MSNFGINIVYFGNGVRGEACLKHLIQEGKSITLVVGSSNTASIRSIAEENNIPYASPDKVNSQEFETQLKATRSNLFVLCGYNKILKSNILEIPKYKVINCHGGKLPEYRGTAPINWQLINGEEIVGFSILYADAGIDTGELIRETRFHIDQNTTAKDLVDKSLKWFPESLNDIIVELESKGIIDSDTQDENAAVHYTRRYPQDGHLDFKNLDDTQIHNLVRALVDPYPGAFVSLDNKQVVIRASEILTETYKGIPGVIALKRNNGCVVPCKNRAILLTKVEVNKELYDAVDFFKIGDRCK